MTAAFPAHAGAVPDTPCCGTTTTHLHAAMNGLDVGLVTFNRRLEVLFSNNKFAMLLDMGVRIAMDDFGIGYTVSRSTRSGTTARS